MQVSSIVSRKNALEGRERPELGRGLYSICICTKAILTVSIHEDITGKGRNFLTRWKGEDLNYKFPLLYPGRHVEELGKQPRSQYFGIIHRLIPQRPQINANEGKNYDT